MNSQLKITNVFCGESLLLNTADDENNMNLSYYDVGDYKANINIEFDKFVSDTDHLSPRIIDLLEISSYVYSADRAIHRGSRSSLMNQGWARSFNFTIPVRDYNFWSEQNVSQSISEALEFMTGDRKFIFSFIRYDNIPNINPDHTMSLFKNEYNTLSEAEQTEIILFSGGLDSLAGTIDYLNNNPQKKVCLVSHKSNNTVKHTQTIIIEYLKKHYTNRIVHYTFETHFKNFTSKDETQRTRMFLFSAIAFAICFCYEKKVFYIYENGVTSINLPKQTDVINARASRTTHPKTIGLLEKMYHLLDNSFSITTPYISNTKSDIIKIFKKNHHEKIISASLSCSSTRNKSGNNTTHCGCCSQCIERRFAIFDNDLQDYDTQYSQDFIISIPDNETKQRLYYTLRFAAMEGILNKQDFIEKYVNELVDIIDYIKGNNPDDKIDEIYRMYCQSGKSILSAAKKIQFNFESLSALNPANSLLEMLRNREHLTPPILARVNEIDLMLKKTIPVMFQRESPLSENDFNDKIQAILSTKANFLREYPILKFGITSYIPDHNQDNLLIESKFIRGKTTPSVISRGIAEDITIAPSDQGLLFIVYDPNRAIKADETFIGDFENKRKSCYVRVYR